MSTEHMKALLEKVERKQPKHNPAMWFMEEVKALGWSISLVTRAYSGSLDAAHSLHSTLVPDYTRSVDATVPEMGITVALHKEGAAQFEGDHEIEARAWFIAILKALIAKGDADG